MRNIRSQFVTILISCAFLFGACDSEIVPDVAPEAESLTPAQAGFGDGWVFVQMGGALVERDLAPGEQIHVNTGCVAAYSPTVDFDLVAAGGVKSVFFGGEGLFFARLTGPGKVWIQSLPFSRLAGRMLQAAGGGGQNAGEGSVLGGLGNLIGGNN